MSLRGHGQSEGREELDSYGLADYVAEIVDRTGGRIDVLLNNAGTEVLGRCRGGVCGGGGRTISIGKEVTQARGLPVL